MSTILVLAGPNGAGKTTISRTLLAEELKIMEFVNADSIAAGLSPFRPEAVAIQAGKFMLARIHELIHHRADFAFETTLATLSYVPLLRNAQAAGYTVKLVFLWLESVQMALVRVAMRVQEGGHSIPTDVIARRYTRGLRNLQALYLPLADEWAVYDNTHGEQTLVAKGTKVVSVILCSDTWGKIKHNSDAID